METSHKTECLLPLINNKEGKQIKERQYLFIYLKDYIRVFAKGIIYLCNPE